MREVAIKSLGVGVGLALLVRGMFMMGRSDGSPVLSPAQFAISMFTSVMGMLLMTLCLFAMADINPL